MSDPRPERISTSNVDSNFPRSYRVLIPWDFTVNSMWVHSPTVMLKELVGIVNVILCCFYSRRSWYGVPVRQPMIPVGASGVLHWVSVSGRTLHGNSDGLSVAHHFQDARCIPRLQGIRTFYGFSWYTTVWSELHWMH